jgi:hypothetical protein
VAKTPTEIRSLARAHTEAAIKALVGIMNQEKAAPAARVSAASVLLDRGWGKPTQPISGDDDGAPLRLEMIRRVIVDPHANTGHSDSEGVPAPAGAGSV